jgi:hypothetical protein
MTILDYFIDWLAYKLGVNPWWIAQETWTTYSVPTWKKLLSFWQVAVNTLLFLAVILFVVLTIVHLS